MDQLAVALAKAFGQDRTGAHSELRFYDCVDLTGLSLEFSRLPGESSNSVAFRVKGSEADKQAFKERWLGHWMWPYSPTVDKWRFHRFTSAD